MNFSIPKGKRLSTGIACISFILLWVFVALLVTEQQKEGSGEEGINVDLYAVYACAITICVLTFVASCSKMITVAAGSQNSRTAAFKRILPYMAPCIIMGISGGVGLNKFKPDDNGKGNLHAYALSAVSIGISVFICLMACFDIAFPDKLDSLNKKIDKIDNTMGDSVLETYDNTLNKFEDRNRNKYMSSNFKQMEKLLVGDIERVKSTGKMTVEDAAKIVAVKIKNTKNNIFTKEGGLNSVHEDIKGWYNKRVVNKDISEIIKTLKGFYNRYHKNDNAIYNTFRNTNIHTQHENDDYRINKMIERTKKLDKINKARKKRGYRTFGEPKQEAIEERQRLGELRLDKLKLKEQENEIMHSDLDPSIKETKLKKLGLETSGNTPPPTESLWKEVQTPDSSVYNPTTGETSWEKPNSQPVTQMVGGGSNPLFNIKFTNPPIIF